MDDQRWEPCNASGAVTPAVHSYSDLLLRTQVITNLNGQIIEGCTKPLEIRFANQKERGYLSLHVSAGFVPGLSRGQPAGGYSVSDAGTADGRDRFVRACQRVDRLVPAAVPVRLGPGRGAR